VYTGCDLRIIEETTEPGNGEMPWPDYLFKDKSNEFTDEDALRRWIQCVVRGFDAILQEMPARIWIDWFAWDGEGRIAVFDSQFEGVVPAHILKSPRSYILGYLDMVRLVWEKTEIGAIRRDFGPVESYTTAGFHYYSIEPFRCEPATYVLEGTPFRPARLDDLRPRFPYLHALISSCAIPNLLFGEQKIIRMDGRLPCSPPRSC